MHRLLPLQIKILFNCYDVGRYVFMYVHNKFKNIKNKLIVSFVNQYILISK
jgi:hypothetical protein